MRLLFSALTIIGIFCAGCHKTDDEDCDHSKFGVRFNGAQSVYFLVECPPQKETFTIELADIAKIQQARDIISGKESRRLHLSGLIVKQAVEYNKPWHWYLKPESINFVQLSVEVCDAKIQDVEDHLTEVGGSLLPQNRWCPWKSIVTKEIPPDSVQKGQH